MQSGQSVRVRRGLITLSGAGILWGSIGIVVRLMQDDGFSTQAIAFWRFLCAALVAVPLLGRAGFGRLRGRLRRPRRLVAVAAGSLAFQLLFFLAVRDVGVAVATLIALGLAPVALTVGETVVTRVLPSPRIGLVLVIALIGLGLVTSSGGGDAQIAPHPVRGVVEATISALCFAVSTSWSARLSTRVEPVAITFAASVVGVVALLPVVAVTGWELPREPSSISGIVWLGVVATVVAYGLFYAGLRSTPGSIAMIITLLEPVTAVVLAAVWLGEPVTIGNALGGLLLLAAVAALYLRPPGSERVGGPGRVDGGAALQGVQVEDADVQGRATL